MDPERSSRGLSRPMMGVLIIFGLVVLLQVPIAFVQKIIQDRVETRETAATEVVQLWGGAQSIVGPRLVVPRIPSPSDSGGREPVNLLPAVLASDARISARPLRRGLFTVPVYTVDLTLRGHFDTTDLPAAGIDDAGLDWSRAMLVIELSDPRALEAGASAAWQGQSVSLLPGVVASEEGRRGIHAEVPRPRPDSGTFEVHLALQGSEALWFVPFARQTEVNLTSDWPHPSFGGAWLPRERHITDTGFTAKWRMPFLGRDYPQVWTTSNSPDEEVRASRFGVTLVSPVDPYRMSERSTKYAALFLVLTFGVLWLFDTMIGLRIHPMQYLLVGAAMCMFYLLELSLGEHMGFLNAYVVAAGAVVCLIGLYAKTVLRSTTRGMILGGSLGGLYAYLFALLTLEQFALLAGSVGLFVALAGVMYLTRWVDWSQLVRAERA